MADDRLHPDDYEPLMNVLHDLDLSVKEGLVHFTRVLEDVRATKLYDKQQIGHWQLTADGFHSFWKYLEGRTGRKWCYEEVMKLWHTYTLRCRYNRRQIPLSHRLYLALETPNKCFCCGSKKELQVHHLIPVSKGGRNHTNNYVWCCARCNKRIGNKLSVVLRA